ncbi:MAG: hypothetical protein AB8B97_16110 [Granulosicoccus sp.]
MSILPSVPQLLMLLFVAIGFVAPLVLVLLSKRTHGVAKVVWFIATILFSWLAYVALLVSTRNRSDKDNKT